MNAAYKYDILDSNHNDYDQTRNTVKGLANVNHKRNLSDYAEELVAHYAKFNNEQYELSLKTLPESEQNELVRLYMEATDRDTGECVHGNDFSIDNDYTCALLAMLKDDSQDNREKFAEITRRNILTYYRLALQEVLDDACHNYYHAMMNEQGYYAHRSMSNGEIEWSKF